MNRDEYILLKGYQIVLRCFLYENDSKTINEQLNINYPSYVELLSGISSMLATDPAYFLINKNASKKVEDIIDYQNVNRIDVKRYISTLKDLLTSIKSLSPELKNGVVNSYIMKELDERFLDHRYTNQNMKSKSLNELKKNILDLESFDYEYLKILDKDKFIYVDNSKNLRKFISSTNYLLKYYPYTISLDNLKKIRNILVKYSKDNYFAALALDNFDSYTFTYTR